MKKLVIIFILAFTVIVRITPAAAVSYTFHNNSDKTAVFQAQPVGVPFNTAVNLAVRPGQFVQDNLPGRGFKDLRISFENGGSCHFGNVSQNFNSEFKINFDGTRLIIECTGQPADYCSP